MPKFPYYIALTLSTIGVFLFLFAMTLASPSEVMPSALWGIVSVVMGLWISAWYEDKKDE